MPCVSSTDFNTTDLVDVNWTVTVINQRRLPPMLLMTPRITPPAHRREREPLGGWTQRFQTAKVTFKVTHNGAFDRPHTISYYYVYLPTYHLFPQI